MRLAIVFFFLIVPFIGNTQTLIILGTLQDGGSPHMGCEKACCANPQENDFVASLGIMDDSGPILIDATLDFVAQTNFLKEITKSGELKIFLTHAHMGHYAGLLHLGREAANAKQIPVYAMPKMSEFLSQNGPWNQLLELENISLKNLQNNHPVNFSSGLSLTPIQVPHRDEYSETVGYLIQGKNKKALYIPDIDKWSKWEIDIRELVREVDYAFLDGTFFADGEVPRPMEEVPHPFITESATLFKSLPRGEREKIIFIHLNHSNPARKEEFAGRKLLEQQGFRFAKFGEKFSLD